MVLGVLVVLFSVFEDYFQGKQCRPVLVEIVCLERGRESSIPCSCHFGLELVPPRRSQFGHPTFRTFDLQGFPVRSLHSNNLCPNI